eukprot:12658121-Alexandrium_andersonii.AAC.1
MYAVSADADYLSNYLRLAHFNSASAPCYRCRADRADAPWSDFRPTARWRDTCLRPVDFVLMDGKHIVFDSPE